MVKISMKRSGFGIAAVQFGVLRMRLGCWKVTFIQIYEQLANLAFILKMRQQSDVIFLFSWQQRFENCLFRGENYEAIHSIDRRIGATYIAVITCACHSTAQHRMKNEPTPKILCFPIQLQLMMIVQMLRFRFYLSIVTRLLWLLYLIWLAQQLAIYLHLITPPNWNELCVSLDSYRRFLYRSILHIMQEQLPSK